MHAGFRAGPYEVLARIAVGGMGEVFVAKRSGAGDFEKRVALKVMLPHLADDSEFRQRFFDEARLAARMEHPNIVQIFDAGETDGRPWLTMALIEGVSLSRLIKLSRAAKQPLPVPVVRTIATGVMEALGYAHALSAPDGKPLGVIHRDITPSNVLISTSGAVLLNDFGIAKAASNTWRTQPGLVRGKVAYVAPEQVTKRTVTQRADFFSAGVTLFEALTGKSPFIRAADLETVNAIAREAPPPIRTLRPDVDASLEAALLRALEKLAEDRFETAKAMREALTKGGAVASAPVLGELVQRLAADDVSKFRALVVAPAAGPGTKSLPIAPLAEAPVAPTMMEAPALGAEPPAPTELARPREVAVAAAAVPIESERVTLKELTPSRGQTVVRDTLIAVVLGAASLTSVWWWSKQLHRVEPQVGTSVDAHVAEEVGPIDAGHSMPVAVIEPELPVDAGVPSAPALPTTAVAVDAGVPEVPRAVETPPKPSVDAGKPKPKGEGFVSVEAEPWAFVSVDGKQLGETPLSRVRIAAGRHVVELKSPKGEVWTKTIVVEEATEVPVRHNFVE